MNQAVERALIDYSNDIWAQAMKAGALEERERVIKLLQDDYWHHLSYMPRLITEEPTIQHDQECLGCKLIALIKGETK